MPLKAPRRVPTSLEVIPFGLPGGDGTWVGCPQCHEPLGLTQPDEQSADRLIGVCQNCRVWFLIWLSTDDSQAMMVLLPDEEWLHDAQQIHEPSDRDAESEPK